VFIEKFYFILELFLKIVEKFQQIFPLKTLLLFGVSQKSRSVTTSDPFTPLFYVGLLFSVV
jgi:hypothetical protein